MGVAKGRCVPVERNDWSEGEPRLVRQHIAYVCRNERSPLPVLKDAHAGTPVLTTYSYNKILYFAESFSTVDPDEGVAEGRCVPVERNDWSEGEPVCYSCKLLPERLQQRPEWRSLPEGN